MKNKGFTLIELLVVVAVIGILATVIIGSLSRAREKAKLAQIVSQFEQIETAFIAALYEEDRAEWWHEDDFNLGENPTLQDIIDIEAPNPGASISNYFKSSPRNIIGNSFYRYDNEQNTVTSCSSGQQHRGVNLIIHGITGDFRQQMDIYIDREDTPFCGKITYNPDSNGTMFWHISDDGSRL